MDPLVGVRRRLAEAIAGSSGAHDALLGEVTLHPHQVVAVQRLLDALQRHGGALLADAPGLGKTYVALAVARALGGAFVVAPAALRTQWLRSAALADVRIEWVSMETLSRRAARSDAPLVVADEAHHLRNPGTQRYAHAAALCVGKRVLLLSATPVHNRAADRDALLALFLGEQAARLSASTLGALIVRREANPALQPRRGAVRWLASSCMADVRTAISSLPPPLPAADGRAAVSLLRVTLAHAWSSSLAALDDTLRRIAMRTAAIDDSLARGRWPTRRALTAWLWGSDATQLAFPELVAASAAPDVASARQTLAEHQCALAALRARVAERRDADTAARAAQLRRLIAEHPGCTIVAFSRYAGTVEALWRALRFDAGVVAVTGRGVRSAGGGFVRRDILAMLAATCAQDARAPLRLVLCTDLLGEGLDLRAASVIVHLDQPWSPARLEQREGRALRPGSSHDTVTVYAVRPPRAAQRFLAIGERLRIKRAAMTESTVSGTTREALLALVIPWLGATRADARVASVAADGDGWIAAVRDRDGRAHIVCGNQAGIREDDAVLLDLLQRTADAPSTPMPVSAERQARRAVREWLGRRASASLARTEEAGQRTRTKVMQRLDALVRATPLHQRGPVRERVAAALARVTAVRGAGAERALLEAIQRDSAEEMLAAIDRIGRSPAHEGPAAGRSRLLALLLLVSRESARAPR